MAENVPLVNGGLSSPVFSGASVTFYLTCSMCRRKIGTLRADDLPAAARVLLKTLFKNPDSMANASPYFMCPDCFTMPTGGP